ncbi:hypothetical protein KL86CLO1_10730 [uncultured Eubacteriales bacterium]|uniref:Uncharacterized protein n=1 Tax=uncultured Eubacteriales bacterium TaxID=172733 RepID=A0A212J9I5_9FIRM|nr:hypothetical protein KL86CLO1_10730 [uncultured Eubacteriales bacterium]
MKRTFCWGGRYKLSHGLCNVKTFFLHIAVLAAKGTPAVPEVNMFWRCTIPWIM